VTAARFSHNLQAARTRQQAAQPGAREVMIVNNYQARGGWRFAA
jgi:hypothetical protein